MKNKEKITVLIQENSILVFGKGTKEHPFCRYSKQTIEILSKYTNTFTVINVLEDESLRQDLKEYSNWPTFPQIYIAQEFIGGADILREMDEAKELQRLLESKA